MNMRISKYLPIGGVAADSHMALPPSMPPPPPSPPNPSPIPRNVTVVAITLTASAALTGKWSMQSVQTEGMGDILWQYDWGPGQGHVFITPAVITPSIITCTLGSTAKYFLPSFAIKERIDGGALGGSGDAPVAISTPAYCIFLETCQDIGGIGFVAPLGLSFQQISSRWVGFNWGDFAAGMLGMIGDALAALALSKFGGKLIPGSWDDQLIGGLASTGMIHLGNALAAMPPAFLVTIGSSVGYCLSWLVAPTAGLVMLAPFAAFAGGWTGGKVGDNWGSGENDWGHTTPSPGASGDTAPAGGGGTPDAGSSPPGGVPTDTGTGSSAGGGGPDGGVGPSDAGVPG